MSVTALRHPALLVFLGLELKDNWGVGVFFSSSDILSLWSVVLRLCSEDCLMLARTSSSRRQVTKGVEVQGGRRQVSQGAGRGRFESNGRKRKKVILKKESLHTVTHPGQALSVGHGHWPPQPGLWGYLPGVALFSWEKRNRRIQGKKLS